MTQRELVLKHLKRGYSLSQAQAIKKWGAYRLGAIVFDLRQNGYNIETTLMPNKTRPGQYASYKIKGVK